MMTYPLAIGGICIIASIIGTFFVRLGTNQSIMGALYKGMIATAILSLVGIAFVTYYLIGFDKLDGVDFSGARLFYCGVVGLVVTGAPHLSSRSTIPAPTIARCTRLPWPRSPAMAPT